MSSQSCCHACLHAIATSAAGHNKIVAAQDKAELQRQHTLLLGKLQPVPSETAVESIGQASGKQQQPASPAEDGSEVQPTATAPQAAEAGVVMHHTHQPFAEQLHLPTAPPSGSQASALAMTQHLPPPSAMMGGSSLWGVDLDDGQSESSMGHEPARWPETQPNRVGPADAQTGLDESPDAAAAAAAAAPSLEELVEAYGHAAQAPPAASLALDDGVSATAITGPP